MRFILLQAVDRVTDWWWALPPWIWVGLVLVGSIVAGYIVEKTALRLMKAGARRTRSGLDEALLEALHPSLAFLLIVAFMWTGLRLLPIRIGAQAEAVLDHASLTLIVVAAAVAVVGVLTTLLRAPARTHQRWQRASITGSRLAAIAVYTVAFLVVIRNFGIEITPILTTLGLAGLAVALALQDTLANFFSGLWVQGQRSLQPGHYVRVEDNQLEGFVVEVGWRTTSIRTLPGNIIVVPNQRIAQSIIQDFWLPEPKMGTSITITTGFEADPERVVPMMLEECMAAADEVSFILKEPAPAARLNRRLDNGWEYWMSIWVPYYYNQWNAQGYVLNRIRNRFLREGIRMPYPIRETYLAPSDRVDFQQSISAVRAPPAPTDPFVTASAAQPPLPSAAVAEGVRPPEGKGRVQPSK